MNEGNVNKTINIISWNVRGFQNPIKRSKILSNLAKQKCDIALIQESHLIEEEVLKLKKKWVGHVYSSSFNSKSRGVLILINKNLVFHLENIIKDEIGRFVAIKLSFGGQKIAVASLYAPNINQDQFFNDIANKLSQWGNIPLILGGDFNTVMDEYIDRSFHNKRKYPRTHNALHNIVDEFGLSDTWRMFHPTERDYTYFSPLDRERERENKESTGKNRHSHNIESSPMVEQTTFHYQIRRHL
uniref:exodeoxyribonuclease III n=1 Tax=Astyanax mexicanus TaxID=7994 RepID=A0A3B1J2S8_ASTMX